MIEETSPEIPYDIFSLSCEEPDLTYTQRCDQLWKEICYELKNEKFLSRSHHNVGTYDQGCRGPLCRKALREHPRRKPVHGVAQQVRDERVYDPVLDYFHTVLKHRIRKYQQELLQELA